MTKTRILVAEDHTIVRQGLCTIINSHHDYEVVGEARNGIEAIAKTKALLPNIVLMDITMSGLNGVEATKQIKQLFPDIKVVILTMHSEKDYIHQILQAGASCYLNKESADTDLISALNAASNNKTYLCPTISRIVMDDYAKKSKHDAETDVFEQLSLREKIILQLISEGCTTKEMATRLSISTNTISNHRANIMKKLDIHDTASLTRYSIKKGLIKI